MKLRAARASAARASAARASAARASAAHASAVRRGARQATPLSKIEMLLLDVDGVLTDGRLYFGARGEALKVFDVRDGHGIRLILASGVRVAAVSGRRAAAVSRRMAELGVDDVVQGCRDKVAALHELCRRRGTNPLACACIVDDTPDLPLMSAVGFAAAVADAHPLVRAAAHWVSESGGGRGAVRELCDRLLRARGGAR